eukprot:1592364-Prymnesium_polylepis.1
MGAASAAAAAAGPGQGARRERAEEAETKSEQWSRRDHRPRRMAKWFDMEKGGQQRGGRCSCGCGFECLRSREGLPTVRFFRGRTVRASRAR